MKTTQKVLTMVLAVVFCFGVLGTALAEPVKSTVAVLPILDNSGFKKSEDTMKMTQDSLSSKFAADKYNVLDVQVVADALKKAGISDLNAAERSDLVTVGKEAGADYVIMTELAPINVVHSQSLFSIQYEATVAVKVKVVDVKQNKYFYTNTFVEKNKNQAVLVGNVGTVAPVKAALKKALERFEAEVDVPQMTEK